MLVLGIILVVVGLGGGALLAFLAAQSATTVTLVAGPVSVGMSPVALFIAGAVTAVLVWGGARVGAVGARHQRRRRHELKDQKRQVAELTAITPVPKTGPKAGPPTGTTGPSVGTPSSR